MHQRVDHLRGEELFNLWEMWKDKEDGVHIVTAFSIFSLRSIEFFATTLKEVALLYQMYPQRKGWEVTFTSPPDYYQH